MFNPALRPSRSAHTIVRCETVHFSPRNVQRWLQTHQKSGRAPLLPGYAMNPTGGVLLPGVWKLPMFGRICGRLEAGTPSQSASSAKY